MNLPKAKKFGGIAFSLPAKQSLDTVVALHTEAYALMNSTTKESISDQLERAWEAYVAKFQEEHGPLPVTAKERPEYVVRLAEALGKKMRTTVSKKSA
jgi:hypothetical protein